jgi:hypothetical protein
MSESRPPQRILRHPATVRLFQSAAQRFLALQARHRESCDLLWAGTLASQFTAAELSLLSDYLCPRDHHLLHAIKKAGR